MTRPNSIYVVGLSHKTAPIQVRERLAMDESGLAQAYRGLRAQGAIREMVLLSTCNRVEAYALVDSKAGEEALRDFLAALDRRHAAAIRKALYQHRGEEAISHLLKVASSLDSMVVGESQILGQVKEAYQRGIEAGTVGRVFHGLFHRVFSAAKEVRSATDIGRHAASVPSVAVSLATHVFGDLAPRRALLLGAGDMAELCAEYLKSAGVAHLVVANRTAAKARDLARRFSAQAEGLEQLETLLAQADVVVSSVGGRTPLVTLEVASRAQQVRKGEPQLMMDISVPRSIAPEVDGLETVYTYNVDSLQQLASQAQGKRLEASRDAEHLLGRWRQQVLDWLSDGQAAPVISALNARVEDLRRAELEKALKKLGHLDAADLEQVEYLTRALAKKILHGPVSRLKGKAGARENAGEDTP